MIELYEVRYEMELRGGGDIWGLRGKVYHHPKFPNGSIIRPSTPVDFKEDVFKTASGSLYKIMSYYGNPEEVKTQILKDIVCCGYEVH
jgi:hypothetical protein